MHLIKNTTLIVLFTIILSLSCKASDNIFNKWTPLYEGVEYRLIQKAYPNTLRIHQMRIDMQNPNVKLIVTPPIKDSHYTEAMKTSSFLEKYNVQVAINGTSYFPFYNEPEGSLKSVEAFAVAGSKQYSSTKREDGAFIILKNGQAKIIATEALDDHEEEIAEGLGGINIDGSALLVIQGEINNTLKHKRRHARTAIGLSEDGNTCYLVVVAGGPRHNFWYKDWISTGVTIKELGTIMQDLGCYNALNLDGSGSSTMAISDLNNRALLINVPSDYRGYIERHVGNHLGIYAKRLNDDHNKSIYGMLKESFTEHYAFIQQVKDIGAGLKFYEGETKYRDGNKLFDAQKYCKLTDFNKKFLHLSDLKSIHQKAINAIQGTVYRDKNEVVWFVHEETKLANAYLGSKLMNLLLGPQTPEVKLFDDHSQQIASKHIIKFVQEPEVLDMNLPIVGDLKLKLAAALIGLPSPHSQTRGYIHQDNALLAAQMRFENSFNFDWENDEENIYQEVLSEYLSTSDIKELNIAIEELIAIPDYYISETLSEGIEDLLAIELDPPLNIEKYQKLANTLIARKQQLQLIQKGLKHWE